MLLQAWLNPTAPDTGLQGNSSDAERSFQLLPLLSVLDEGPQLPDGGLSVAVGGQAPVRVDYVAARPAAVLWRGQ
jgi:hypothetical protein